MADQNETYLNMMADVLKKKAEVLKALYEESLTQDKLLSAEQFDREAFDKTIDAKEKLLDRLNGLDDGFMDLFDRVKAVMKEHTGEFAEIISLIQGYIRELTEHSNSIEALEQRNSLKMSAFLTKGKKKIKDYKLSSKTVSAYYKNMAGHHQEGDSYFFDKEK